MKLSGFRSSRLLREKRLWVVLLALILLFRAGIYPKWTYDDPRFQVMTGEVSLPPSEGFPSTDTPRSEWYRFIPLNDHESAVFERERAWVFVTPPPFFQCSVAHRQLLLSQYRPPPTPVVDWSSSLWNVAFVLVVGGFIWKGIEP
ncbi:hypothetical protein [Tolypothrix sp. VBCCA 56010]|uniref:hypothetical protein n=1 Tax=Tolypothrix sp. VBCCA 56010 TaxID=3137731 RepID=UPI003D7E53AC